MKYFLLYQDPAYVDAPAISDWRGKIEVRSIMPGRSHLLENRQVLGVQPNSHMVFTDMLSSPFLLLSSTCMDVVKIYEPYISSKQVVLLDFENRQKQLYYLPILQHISCLAEGSRWNMDKSVLFEGVIDLEKIRETSIFYLSDLKNMYTVIRLDILESMLKRGAKGLAITELRTLEV